MRPNFGATNMLLDIFALIVLLTLLVTIVGGALVLGWLPGRLAAQRNHPQADAIRICGWLGLITAGLLLPIAYIWVFIRPVRVGVAAGSDAAASSGTSDQSDVAAELRELRSRLAALEAKGGKS